MVYFSPYLNNKWTITVRCDDYRYKNWRLPSFIPHCTKNMLFLNPGSVLILVQ